MVRQLGFQSALRINGPLNLVRSLVLPLMLRVSIRLADQWPFELGGAAVTWSAAAFQSALRINGPLN